MWQRVKTGSKKGFDSGWRALDKLGAPVNKLSNKLGSEAFWPTTLDKESDKAARILKSFCKDGFYTEEEVQPVDGPKQKQRVVKKIPEEVIRNCKGLAIFTTMRTGLWVSGAGGSGVLVAKKEDGSWSPPSGIMLHTAGLGFLVGVDIYDCVLVLNTVEALEAFSKVRCTLGGEISVVAGPVGIGGVLETEIHKRQAPVFTYMKSRGFYAGVQIDGTIVIERCDENERFYEQELPVKEILAGNVRHPPYEVKRLMETIKSAQGDTDYDRSMIPHEAPPADYEIEDPNVFGIPDRDDPDPYGVLALEREGMSLRESGTQKRASWEQFSFQPSPSSPIHSLFARNSQDGRSSRPVSTTRSSWRASSATIPGLRTPSSLRTSMEFKPVRSPVTMADSSTQTELPDSPTLSSRRSTGLGIFGPHSSKNSVSSVHTPMQDVPEDEILAMEHMHQDVVTKESLEDQHHSKDFRGAKSDKGRIHEAGPNLREISPKRLDNSHTPPSLTRNGYSTPPETPSPVTGAPRIFKDDNRDRTDDEYDGDEDDDDDDLRIIDEPVIHSVQNVQPATTQVVSKIRLVEVPKRLPPKLPPRNPNRASAIAGAQSPNRSSVTAEGRDVESDVSQRSGPDLRDIAARLRSVDLDDDDEHDFNNDGHETRRP
ncbi:DUF500-domain-containing protein [Zymoseptoria brevis]|uniref:DUF500-domain-containing protein n=1 Tax=Zymoseptoria brevis TaxID=1047168 RepID=A0A0F4GAJ5_9PEZI|nr:DUF500-domain-containing protein [Zymoseptoria brevis]